jgi:phosphatidylcholine synthase
MTKGAAPGHPPGRVAFAWSVHLFTASGGVVGLATLRAAAAGDLREAALLMLVALAIDAVDGSLARAARVGEVLPGIDGRRLDDIVDYLNYVAVPAAFMIQAESLVHWSLAAIPVLASAYGFAQTDAKTEDHFFVGFPSYWNVVALYLWALDIAPIWGSLLVVALAGLVFVPTRYVYPSRMKVLWWSTNALGVIWTLVLAAALAFPSSLDRYRIVEFSLLYPLYYLGLSFWIGGLHRRLG